MSARLVPILMLSACAHTEAARDRESKSEDGGVRLITESEPWHFDRPWETLVRLLGGIEVSGHSGWADVDSGVRDEAGETFEVASGKASQLGWGISLYWDPEATGFFIRPAAGFLSQRIDIADFRADLPLASVPDAQEIAGECESLDSGATIDCDAPNVYGLRMRSGYLGARGGYALVAAAGAFRWVAFLGGGVNLVEYRSIDVDIASYRSNADGWALVRSLGGEASVGIYVPDWHLSLRAMALFDYYFGFSYAEPLSFLGPVTFDDTVGQNRRPVMRVRDAQLSSWKIGLATAFVF